MLLGELRSVSKLFQIPRYNHFIIYRVRYSLTLSLLNLSCTFVTQNQTDNHIVNYLNTSRHQLGANERQISSKYFESMSVLSKNHPISLKRFPYNFENSNPFGQYFYVMSNKSTKKIVDNKTTYPKILLLFFTVR